VIWTVIPLVIFSIVGISGIFGEETEFIASPKHQLESGVAPEDVICKEDRFLVIRSNGQPVCVTERLIEKMNWDIIKTIAKSTPIELKNTLKTNVNSEITSEEKSAETNLILTREIIYGDEGINLVL